MSDITPNESKIVFEEILEKVKRLTPREKLRLVTQVTAQLEEIITISETTKPLNQLHGLLADLGAAPSAEDIDEVRAEMLKNFPREDNF